MWKPTRPLVGLLVAGAAAGCGSLIDPIKASPADASVGGGASGGATGLDAGGTGGSVEAGGTDGATGGVPGCPTTECPLMPNDTGWVEGYPPCCPVQGAWFYYDDCNDSPGNCTQRQGAAGDAGSLQPEPGKNKICTAGTTAAAGDASSTIWGAGIALWLNQVKNTELHNPIGMLRPRVPAGFRFTLSGTLGSGGLRVNFPYRNVDTEPQFVPLRPDQTGEVTVMIDEATQGSWVSGPVPITREAVIAIQFQTPALPDESVHFDFCVEGLTAIFEKPDAAP